MERIFSTAPADGFRSWDSFGIVASSACALHCLLAPAVMILAPALGGRWADPSTHVVMACIAVPVAAVALLRGFVRHRRKRILLLGIVGSILIMAAAIFPWLPDGKSVLASTESAAASCGSCCPVPEVDPSTGGWSLRFPPASVLSLFGGVVLIGAHFTNRACCKTCGA